MMESKKFSGPLPIDTEGTADFNPMGLKLFFQSPEYFSKYLYVLRTVWVFVIYIYAVKTVFQN